MLEINAKLIEWVRTYPISPCPLLCSQGAGYRYPPRIGVPSWGYPPLLARPRPQLAVVPPPPSGRTDFALDKLALGREAVVKP